MDHRYLQQLARIQVTEGKLPRERGKFRMDIVQTPSTCGVCRNLMPSWGAPCVVLEPSGRSPILLHVGCFWAYSDALSENRREA